AVCWPTRINGKCLESRRYFRPSQFAQKRRVVQPVAVVRLCAAPSPIIFILHIDRRLHFFLSLRMNDRFSTTVELVVFAAFIAAVFIVVMTSLTFLSNQCSRGTPVLPAIFPCFQEG